MIKRIFLTTFFILLLTGICIGGPTSDLVMSGGDGALVCTLDATGKWETQDDTLALIPANAYGQTFQVGTAGDLCKICVQVGGDGGDTFDMRVGNGVDLDGVNLWEDFGTSGDIASQQWYCFDSVDEDTFATGTDYYLGLKETSGAVVWYNDTGAGYASGTPRAADSGWDLGGVVGHDHNFRVYTWQPPTP